MSNQLSALLKAWQSGRDDTDWVLGTVFKTEGSAYRKAGAMMLINGLGQHFGLLSGGCLEADILRLARRVMHGGQVRRVVYDGSDEDDWSFRLGIGCGGKVYIQLQPVLTDNDLGLGDMAAALTRRESGRHHLQIGGSAGYFEAGTGRAAGYRGLLEQRDDGEWLVTPVIPEPHLLVVGGGIDARPLVALAAGLGWRVSLADPRPANARAGYFPAADAILRTLGDELGRYIDSERVDAAVIMSHNVDIDAEALRICQGTELGYLALLGPGHRYHRVLGRAGLAEADLDCPVAAPAGLDIGGQLPESIALSILAECHAVLHRSQSLPALRLAAN